MPHRLEIKLPLAYPVARHDVETVRNTPVETSLLAGQQATAKVLLDNGADGLVRQAHGFTPPHEAALLGRRDLVDLLLDHGAELNSRADDGRTPVTKALRGGHRDLAVTSSRKEATVRV